MPKRTKEYDDGSMAIRIAEYAFIVARQSATWDIGQAVIPMPHFSVIYVKRTTRTPKTTTVTFTFPDGQSVVYQSDNVILEEFTKEYIVEKRLFPYIPFYIARHEKEIAEDKGSIENAIADLEYFRDEMIQLHEEHELSDYEVVDLMGLVNTIITHITDGNQNERRLVSIMGGVVLETESERLIRIGRAEGQAKGIIEMGQELGLADAAILERLQKKLDVSYETAVDYLKQYGKALV
jgi:hypothetical protein